MLNTLYVDVKIDECIRSSEIRVSNMINLHEKIIEKYDENLENDLNVEKTKLYNNVLSLKLYLDEMEIYRLSKISISILQRLERFNVLTADYRKFSEVINKYLDSIKKRHKIDSSAAGRLWNNIKMGYYPTDQDNLAYIKKAITFPSNTLSNILDPCCGCGKALSYLAEGTKCKTYGIELDEIRAEEARKRLTRIGKGSYFGSRVSHEAFHMIYLNPPYLTVYSDGHNVRSEKKFLVQTLYHLVYGGLLIYVIPYYRVTPDIARILSDNFDDIAIYKFTESEFKKYKQIAIFGVRKKKESNRDVVNMLVKQATYPELIPDVTMLKTGQYKIPAAETEVKIFKGAVFDVAELAEQLNDTKMIEDLFKESLLDNTEKRPLIPFTIGQIGLIGGSGLIDGYIDCSYPHILKGQIVKERKITDEKEDFNGNTTNVTEQIINKMNLKVLTEEGVITLV